MGGLNNFERQLIGIFDKQRFYQNSDLKKLINESEQRYSKSQGYELSDDELELVSAAGDANEKKTKNINQIVIATSENDEKDKSAEGESGIVEFLKNAYTQGRTGFYE